MNVPSPFRPTSACFANWILGLAMLGSVTGCVTTQQYEALQVQLDEAEGENSALRLARQDAEVNSRELEGRLGRLTQEQETLTKEAQQLGADARLVAAVHTTLGGGQSDEPIEADVRPSARVRHRLHERAERLVIDVVQQREVLVEDPVSYTHLTLPTT